MVNALVNGRILLPDREVRGQALLFDEKIRGISSEVPSDARVLDAEGCYISPGFVDVHIHGYLGEDASDGSVPGLRRMSEGILHNGVTSFLPTTMTVPWPELEAAFEAVRALREESLSPAFPGAEILGVHAEGPFINPKKKGAQSEAAILPPDADRMLPFSDLVWLITVAPEMPGGLACIERLSRVMSVSVGHTDADFDTARKALSAGADHFTHTFNAMTPLNHRNPGAVGAALTGSAWCELIADTFHVHPGVFSLLRKTVGDRRQRPEDERGRPELAGALRGPDVRSRRLRLAPPGCLRGRGGAEGFPASRPGRGSSASGGGLQRSGGLPRGLPDALKPAVTNPSPPRLFPAASKRRPRMNRGRHIIIWAFCPEAGAFPRPWKGFP